MSFLADEIIEKHRSFGKANVRRGARTTWKPPVARYPHWPYYDAPAPAKRFLCQGQEESFEEFVTNHCHALVLELTQQCNLRCEYCCYGEHYPQFRRIHGDTVMSFETATKAVEAFFARPHCDGHVDFYGGEPLLECGLLKRIVLFTEELGHRSGITPHFALATNGTLLTDDTIDFLVAHNVEVAVSVDGDRDSHNRHRVFRNEQHPERRIGSYDVMMQNMNRFVELFPEYVDRRITVTLTATSDFDAINEALRPFAGHCAIVGQFVRIPDNGFNAYCDGRAVHAGCWNPSVCAGPCCTEHVFSSAANRDH